MSYDLGLVGKQISTSYIERKKSSKKLFFQKNKKP
jgi:hypothetical protein